MKRLLAAFVASALIASAGVAGAGPTAGGFASDNVEYAGFIPFEAGTAIGARVIGKYMYVTTWKAFSIYDVSDPLNPVRLATEPFGFQFENEDVDTNGKIMLFSESTPINRLHIWDIEDKSNPVEVAVVPGAGNHTSSCILKCKYSYGSSGAVTDLRNPAKPKVIGDWSKGIESAHDVTEVAPGIVLTSSRPIQLLDARKNPAKPKVLAKGDDKAITGGVHSNTWPRLGKDKFFLLSSESNFTGRCSGSNGAFMVWDASKYKKTRSFTMLDIYQLDNGTWVDGKPGATASGCSSHWFQEHPRFKNGGLVAMGSYDHGTRFINVSKKGKISEKGYFVPYGGQTSAAYWLTKRIVYAVDVTRGVDILKYNGKI